MEPKHLSDFVSNTLSAYVRVLLQFILPKKCCVTCLFDQISQDNSLFLISWDWENRVVFFLVYWHRLTEIAGSFTKTILELPQTVLMSQSGVWIFYIKWMYITSGNHRKCWIYVVHLAQHSAPDSKTQHKAFTGTFHGVLMNNSQKCCCFLLANPW